MELNASHNAAHLQDEFKWLEKIFETRLALRFKQDAPFPEINAIPQPDFDEHSSVYADFVRKHNLSFEERIILLLSLVPHIKPALFDSFFLKGKDGAVLAEFGGIKNGSHNGFQATAETALFILAGDDLNKRFESLRYFHGDHLFAKERVLSLEKVLPGDPFLSGVITLHSEFLELFTVGSITKPIFGNGFPAKEITTKYEWSDLVLESRTMSQIDELSNWIEHSDLIMNQWGLAKKLKPGFLCLFYGPPGTGKTLTAALIAKSTGRPVYRIDLSMVVSKYIGETEKNLSNIFQQAENKNWILFFDEADALFGKRTKVNDAHDRYANQEVSYLLQRIEDFQGMTILASNMKSNMDEAFLRRFQAVIHFPMPRITERRKLWEMAFPEACVVEDNVDFRKIADLHEISGSAIMNVVRYCALMAARKKTNKITLKNINEGIRREFSKEGKLV